MKLSRETSLLGLSFDGRRMTAVVMRRAGEGVALGKQVEARLSLDPIGSEPVLAGREIRTQLDGAEIRTRRCVVCVPVSWALTSQVTVPSLEGTDLDSYLALQAEREFPFPPADLSISVHLGPAEETPRRALIAALPKSRLRALENVLHAAGLKPRSITFGVTALAAGGAETTALALAGENAVDLCIAHGGGVAALRALEGPADAGSEGYEFDTETLGRELRVTLRRLPEEASARVRRLRLEGPAGLVKALEDDLRGHAALGDFEVARGDASATPALAAASRFLRGEAPVFEFLPPRVSPLRRLVSGAANRGVRVLVPVAVGVVLLTGGLFLFQQQRLARLEGRWESMREETAELAELQDRIRTYRDWFSDDAPSLKLTEGLTEAFPEEGSAWARTVTLKDRNEVACAGSARSNEAWLAVFGRLNEDTRVTNLKVGQVTGEDPLQFTFSYQWRER